MDQLINQIEFQFLLWYRQRLKLVQFCLLNIFSVFFNNSEVFFGLSIVFPFISIHFLLSLYSEDYKQRNNFFYVIYFQNDFIIHLSKILIIYFFCLLSFLNAALFFTVPENMDFLELYTIGSLIIFSTIYLYKLNLVLRYIYIIVSIFAISILIIIVGSNIMLPIGFFVFLAIIFFELNKI